MCWMGASELARSVVPRLTNRVNRLADLCLYDVSARPVPSSRISTFHVVPDRRVVPALLLLLVFNDW